LLLNEKIKLEDIVNELLVPSIDSNKRLIRSNLKGQAGVYMFYNNITGHYYIGSSVNLYKRFNSNMNLIPTSELPLYRAIRKYIGPLSQFISPHL